MTSCPLVLNSQGLQKLVSTFRHQTSDFDYKVVIKKNPTLLAIFYAVFRYLAATQCISMFKYIGSYMSFIFYYLYLIQLAYSYIFYSKFVRLFKIRYSTVSVIKELHLYSFELYQQVLYFNKQKVCGKKTIELDMWRFSVTKSLRTHSYSYIYIKYIL